MKRDKGLVTVGDHLVSEKRINSSRTRSKGQLNKKRIPSATKTNTLKKRPLRKNEEFVDYKYVE